MNSILKGLYAGLAAGAILAVLFFVDYGPGNSLYTVASWFSLDSKDTARLFGFVLLIILGGLFGLLFGILQRNREVTFRGAVVTGLMLGVAWWVIFPLLLGLTIGHIKLSFGGILFGLTTSLVYGLLLGTLYFQSTVSREMRVSQ